MTEPSKRYPLSNAQGESIPLDVIRPVSAASSDFTAGAATAAIAVPATVDVLIVLSTADCWAKFATSASVAAIPANNTVVDDLLFIPAGFQMTVAPPIGKKSLSFIGDSGSGTVFTQFLETWTGTPLSSQLTRQ